MKHQIKNHWSMTRIEHEEQKVDIAKEQVQNNKETCLWFLYEKDLQGEREKQEHNNEYLW